VSGLSLSSIQSDKPSVVLPNCYSRKELPIDAIEVPTARKVDKWSYLKIIQSFLP